MVYYYASFVKKNMHQYEHIIPGKDIKFTLDAYNISQKMT